MSRLRPCLQMEPLPKEHHIDIAVLQAARSSCSTVAQCASFARMATAGGRRQMARQCARHTKNSRCSSMVTAVSMPANHGKACAIASAMRITELVPPWTQVGNVDMLNCYYAHGDDSEDVRLQVILPLFASHSPPHSRRCMSIMSQSMPGMPAAVQGDPPLEPPHAGTHRSGGATGCWRRTRTSCWCTTCRRTR